MSEESHIRHSNANGVPSVTIPVTLFEKMAQSYYGGAGSLKARKIEEEQEQLLDELARLRKQLVEPALARPGGPKSEAGKGVAQLFPQTGWPTIRPGGQAANDPAVLTPFTKN